MTDVILDQPIGLLIHISKTIFNGSRVTSVSRNANKKNRSGLNVAAFNYRHYAPDKLDCK